AIFCLRMAGGQLERARLGGTALHQRIHHELRAMGEHPVRVQLAIAAWCYADSQECAQEIARYETWAARDRLAVVGKALRGEIVLEPPGHADRVVVLDMLRQLRLARADDRFTQARNSEARGESRAEADFVDECERALRAGHPERRFAAEMMVAMRLQALEDCCAGRCVAAHVRTWCLGGESFWRCFRNSSTKDFGMTPAASR